ncbi:GNAT family N-acetyltransferase [Mesorhizobium sp. RP14(2022)]|uniref:GNAT family N-acetyltransferase n=1 Tax=Mesorhizobium liriopis TaxID=2953882 RepID=A0ABT1C1D7_9HYPH|nr:GNAT family N-acetyltransferase [Mesorhizobium liriopis]MCO6048308.1 GNAT family N-acetyltransferase [Mesorhizobium liriopis]
MPEIIIRPVEPGDLDQWLLLWQGYLEFYKQPFDRTVTETTWARFFDPSEPVHALVAESENQLVGVTHYIFHRNTWMVNPVCYLQDLFTAPQARGRGVGRKLIEAVYEAAKAAGSPRVYWLTRETNAQAIALYAKIAERSGFIQFRKAIDIAK